MKVHVGGQAEKSSLIIADYIWFADIIQSTFSPLARLYSQSYTWSIAVLSAKEYPSIHKIIQHKEELSSGSSQVTWIPLDYTNCWFINNGLLVFENNQI